MGCVWILAGRLRVLTLSRAHRIRRAGIKNLVASALKMLRRPDFFSHLGEVSFSNPVPSTSPSLGGEIKIYPAIKEADIRALVSAGDACLSSRRRG